MARECRAAPSTSASSAVRIAEERRDEPRDRRAASPPSSRAGLVERAPRAARPAHRRADARPRPAGWIQASPWSVERQACATTATGCPSDGTAEHDVVVEAGQRELGRARAAADLVARLEHDAPRRRPARAWTAAARPLGPEPTTTASRIGHRAASAHAAIHGWRRRISRTSSVPASNRPVAASTMR